MVKKVDNPYLLQSGVRIASLDAWRGLAAMMVVTLHATEPALIGPYPELQNERLYRFVGFGNYGVQIFFVVSGFCVAQAAIRAFNKPAPLAAFVKARLLRIYPPYVIVSMLGVLMSALAAYLVTQKILPNSSIGAEALFARPIFDYACSALLLQRACHVVPLVPAFWTLCYEAAFYALVAATQLAAVTFRRDRLVLDLCHGLTLVCSVAMLVAPDMVPYPFDLWPEFGLGVLALDILTLRRPMAYGVLLATVLLQAAYASTHFRGGADYKAVPGIAAIVSIAFCLFLIGIKPIDDRIARFLPIRLFAYVGVFSYSLYLLHSLIIGPVAQIIKILHIASASTYWISALAQISSAVLAARLFYAMAERPFLTRRRTQINLEAIAPSR